MAENKALLNWEEKEKELGSTVDKLDYPIDPGIKETIIVLNLLGFPTSASCEGHLDRAVAAPWVDIISNDTDSLKGKADAAFGLADESVALHIEAQTDQLYDEANRLREVAFRPLLLLGEKLLKLMEKFYENRKVLFDQRITLEQFGYSLRIYSQGAVVQDALEQMEKAKRLASYQIEMKEFTEFLKGEYFSRSALGDL